MYSQETHNLNPFQRRKLSRVPTPLGTVPPPTQPRKKLHFCSQIGLGLGTASSRSPAMARLTLLQCSSISERPRYPPPDSVCTSWMQPCQLQILVLRHSPVLTIDLIHSMCTSITTYNRKRLCIESLIRVSPSSRGLEASA